MYKGRCECGAVVFEAVDARPSVTICHCKQCRRTSGHVWASTQVKDADMRLISADTLVWYDSSDFAKRGFCSVCGSSLFYRINGEDHYAVAAGVFDEPTDLHLGKHIFVKDKGDYYEISDDVPQLERW